MVETSVTVDDEEVIDALLRDAKRFKSKWELNTNEQTRSKPNTKFLKRTLSHVVKTNSMKMRRPRRAESYERELKSSPDTTSNLDTGGCSSSHSSTQSSSKREETKKEDSPELQPKKRRKSRNCSKSKHRSHSAKRKVKDKKRKKN